MSSPYERVKAGKLTFKGGLGPEKSIDKKKKKKHKKKLAVAGEDSNQDDQADKKEIDPKSAGFTIDVATKKNYEELFPVEAKKFGYAASSNPKSLEEALDQRVKKKADRVSMLRL